MINQLNSFDTLDHANRLKTAGFPAAQAKVLAQMQKDFFQLLVNIFATKQDLEHKMVALEHRLLIKLGGMMAIGLASLATLITILHVY